MRSGYVPPRLFIPVILFALMLPAAARAVPNIAGTWRIHFAPSFECPAPHRCPIVLERIADYIFSQNGNTFTTVGSFITFEGEFLSENQISGRWKYPGGNPFCPSGRYDAEGTFTGQATDTTMNMVLTGIGNFSDPHTCTAFTVEIGGQATGTRLDIPEMTLDVVDAMDCRDGAIVTDDPVQLATCGRVVSAIAADGVAKLLIRVNLSQSGVVTFSREPAGSAEQEGVLRSLDGTQVGDSVTARTVATLAGEQAFAIYEAPLDFVRIDTDKDLTSREFLLRAVFTADAGGASSEAVRPFILLRPPVVLVHGLWANTDVWNYFKPLINDTRFSRQRVSYSTLTQVIDIDPPTNRPIVNPPEPLRQVDSNALGILYNAKIVLPKIRRILQEFREAPDPRSAPANPLSIPAAVVQADFVAHSMGGLVTRALPLVDNFMSEETFGKGVIHKLITIGTPHMGTPVASALLMDENGANRKLREEIFAQMGLYVLRSVTLVPSKERVPGAVFDLQSNSGAIAALRDSPIQIPTSMIAGKMTLGQLNALVCDLCVPAIIRSYGNNPLVGDNPLARMFTPEGWLMILGGDSDGIVPVTSQLNGLSANAPSIRIFPAIHSQGARDLGFGVPDIGYHLQQEGSGVPEAVIDLLNTSITSDAYILLPQ